MYISDDDAKDREQIGGTLVFNLGHGNSDALIERRSLDSYVERVEWWSPLPVLHLYDLAFLWWMA